MIRRHMRIALLLPSPLSSMLVHIVVVSAATTTHLLILKECRVEVTLAALKTTCSHQYTIMISRFR